MKLNFLYMFLYEEFPPEGLDNNKTKTLLDILRKTTDTIDDADFISFSIVAREDTLRAAFQQLKEDIGIADILIYGIINQTEKGKSNGK